MNAIASSPGARRLFLLSLVARLPTAMLSIGLLVHARHLTGSFAAAGLVTGAYGVALGVGGPLLGQLVDRRGQTAVLVGSAAVAVVLGHVYPVFFGFRGGKGVATSAGALGALAPVAMALGIVLFVVLLVWKRYVSLGSMVTAAAFPLLVFLCCRLGWSVYGGPGMIGASVAIALVIMAKHARNLKRLRDGTEPRLGEPGEPRPEPAGGAGR